MVARVRAGPIMGAFDGLLNDGSKSGSGTLTYDTSVKTSLGAASYKFNSGASNQLVLLTFAPPAASLNTNTYFKGDFQLPSTLANGTQLMYTFASSTSAVPYYLMWKSSDGSIDIKDGATDTVRGNTGALSFNTWYRLEVRCKINTGSTDELEFRLNGSVICNLSSMSLSESHIDELTIGFTFGAPGANKVTHWANICYNDDTTSNQNSWVGGNQILLSKPTSDSAIGSWTGGAGGTTNLYDAVDNVPPVGVNSASDTNTSQIKTSTNSTTYTANCQSYSTLGIASGDTINLVQPIVVHGEEVGTGSKTGTVGATTNPTISGTSITFGGDAGAEGTYPTNWQTTRGTISYAPTPTLGTQPTISVVSTTLGSRVVSVCFMGILVDVTPSTEVTATLTGNTASTTLSSNANIAVTATLTNTFGSQTLSSNTNVPVTASLTANVSAPTLSATVSAVFNVTASGNTPSTTLSVVASVSVIATASNSVPATTISADASVSVTATLSLSQPNITLSAAANVTVSVSISASEASPNLSSNANVSVAATFSGITPDTTLSSDAVVPITATVSKSLGTFTCTSTANVSVEATASNSVAETLIANANVTVTANASISAPSTDISANANVAISATLNANVEALTLSNVTAVSVTSALSANAAETLSSTASVSVVATLSANVTETLTANTSVSVAATLTSTTTDTTLTANVVIGDTPISATVSGNVPATTASATAAVAVQASVSQETPNINLSGVVGVAISASVVSSTPNASMGSAASVNVSASVDMSFAAATLTSVSRVAVTAVVTGQLPNTALTSVVALIDVDPNSVFPVTATLTLVRTFATMVMHEPVSTMTIEQSDSTMVFYQPNSVMSLDDAEGTLE